MALAVALAVLIGISLGLLGGGGSILAVPVLVYAAGLDPRRAIASSLLIVGTTSVAALVPRARAGLVRWRVGALFGGAGMVGAFLGGRLARLVPGPVLLLGFTALMLVTAVSMMRPRREAPTVPSEVPARTGRMLALGAAVGLISGLVGAGGGFVIVPALALLGGLTMETAVATSLFVIALQSLAGFAGHAGEGGLPWALIGAVTAAAIAGSLVGTRLSRRVSPASLRAGFGGFVVLVALITLSRQLTSTPLGRDLLLLLHPDWVRALAGGALIGLSASLLLGFNGRILGVSGIVGGVVHPTRGDVAWRALFVGGLLLGGVVALVALPGAFTAASVGPGTAIMAGLLVGVGTRLGSGCTSGHGVCGLSRLSTRSLAATLTFIGAGALTVLATGGAP